MKISKLFHWLYAILMFLPIMVFIPNAFYYGFNEHAVAQEKTEQVPIYYESNEVVSVDDLISGRIYKWTNNYIINLRPSSDIVLFTIQNNSLMEFLPYYNDETFIQFRLHTDGNVYIRTYYEGNHYEFINTREFDFVLLQIHDSNTLNTLIQYFSESNVKYVKEYQPLVTNMSITDSMSYAWDSVWQNDLFSWTYDSFLTQPFLYITNLFNVPVTNTLVYCLSYWLNLSIIWLTFDVVMYVPLLVHRWLDKGIIE